MSISDNKRNKIVELYLLAEQLYELKPWTYLSDLDYIQVLDPAMEPTLIVVLGQEKIFEGFNFIIGVDNTTSFLAHTTTAKEESEISILRYYRTFVLGYEKYEDLEDDEKEIIKACYDKVSYSQVYPSFVNREYGIRPRLLLLKEINLMIKLCKRLIKIIVDAQTFPTKPDYLKNDFLIHLFSEKSKSFETYIGPLMYDLYYQVPSFKFPYPKLPLSKTNDLMVEIDSLFIPVAIGKTKNLPLINILTNALTGEILHHSLIHPPVVREEAFTKFYLECITKFGHFKNVIFRNGLDYDIITINYKKKVSTTFSVGALRGIDNFLNSFLNFDKPASSEYIN